ncbi:MAG: HAD family hydrolase [Bryobacterales bacterium]|nr:HAD family hydrolase [Bryobacterales bacterium]
MNDAANELANHLANDLVIFDLDGTLIDSKEDLINSVNAVLSFKHRDPLPADTIASYIGNGAPMLIQRALPDLDEDQHLEALQFFLDYYREHMLDATVLYPGVREALDRLHRERVPMAILTNKPVRFSVRLIAGLGLSSHFFQIYGGNSFEEKKPHPIGIERLIVEASADRQRTVMVGDSAVDVLTARNALVQACGVSWGFQPETFAQAPPDFIVDDLRQLAERVLDRRGSK